MFQQVVMMIFNVTRLTSFGERDKKGVIFREKMNAVFSLTVFGIFSFSYVRLSFYKNGVSKTDEQLAKPAENFFPSEQCRQS